MTEVLDDRTAFADAVRDLLRQECPADVVRSAWPGGDDAPARRAWRRLAGTGAFATLVPPERGGLGLDETYLVAVLEQVGYAGLPGPATDVAAAAAPLLAEATEHETLHAALLAGDATVAVVRVGGGAVPYGQIVDAVLVLDEAGARLHEIGPADRQPVDSIDGARRLTHLHLSTPGRDLRVAASAVRQAALRATLATAAELVGLSRRMLDLTVPYVTGREQFGVPIGSFQAVKHHLADALLAIEFAAPLVRRAARELAVDAGTASLSVSMAKMAASQTATEVAKATLQCHGAMAYTTEYDHHLFAKRAWALAAAWGSAAIHRRIVAAELGVAPGATAEGRLL